MLKKVLVFVTCCLSIFLFACNKDEDDNDSRGIHPSINVSIEEYSAVKTTNFVYPQLEIKVKLKNTGDSNLKYLSFKCEVTTNTGQKSNLDFIVSELSILPGQELERSIVSMDPIRCSKFEEDPAIQVTIVKGLLNKEEIEAMYNEVIESVSLVENSVNCI